MGRQHIAYAAVVGLLAASCLLQINAQAGALSGTPRVRLAQNYIVVPPDTDTAQLSVDLASPSNSDIKVSLGVFSHDGTRLAPQLAANWAPGEVEPRSIEVSGLQQLLGGARRSVIVRITATNNAAIDTWDSSALVSLDAGLPQFAFRRNAAAFPGDQPKIEIVLESGQITQPATLRYRFEPFIDQLIAVQPPFLRSSGTSGFLHIDANSTALPGETVSTIAVPIDWNQVREDAQYKLSLHLEGFYASWVAEQRKDVALHVFGVAQGTCPPGSAVKSSNSSSNSDDKKDIGSSSVARTGGTAASSKISAGSTTVTLADLLPGGGGLSLLVGASPVSLSTLESNIGAMVERDADKAVLCVSNLDARVIPAQSDPHSTSTAKTVPAGACPPSAIGATSFQGTAWELGLLPGPNLFNITTTATSAAVVQLSIVRLADPSHAQVLSLEARGLDGGVVVVCGPPALSLGGENSNTGIEYSTLETKAANLDIPGAPVDELSSSLSPKSDEKKNRKTDDNNKDSRSDVVEMVALDAWKPCVPGGAMSVTVPANTETVSLTPTLLHPEILDIRVEVNGQVLSRGGNVWADQQADTRFAGGRISSNLLLASSSDNGTNNTTNTAFVMPGAFIMGMQPGVAVDVEVVVLAEDGVTSSRYPVTITRDYGDAAGGGVEYVSTAKEQQQGWPSSPAELGNCDVCPAGWTSTKVNASSCEMCPPGTAAAIAGIGSCTPCNAGTFSLPWGSTHCKHCISGTHAPTEKATSCLMCPDGMTTVEDGQAHCNVTLAPATDLQVRYAVLVYFSVNLTGSDPEDIVLRSGVSAPAEIIVSNLLRTDTAAAFNISMQDVKILSVHRVARRTLQANVSATLGLDLPGNATDEDVAAALEVQKLSADRPIELLSEDPDSFFGRTTKALDVGVEAAADVEKVESRPVSRPPFSRWILVAPGIVGVMAGSMMLFTSWRKKRGRQSSPWVNTLRITPAAQRYVRQAA